MITSKLVWDLEKKSWKLKWKVSKQVKVVLEKSQLTELKTAAVMLEKCPISEMKTAVIKLKRLATPNSKGIPTKRVPRSKRVYPSEHVPRNLRPLVDVGRGQRVDS